MRGGIALLALLLIGCTYPPTDPVLVAATPTPTPIETQPPILFSADPIPQAIITRPDVNVMPAPSFAPVVRVSLAPVPIPDVAGCESEALAAAGKLYENAAAGWTAKLERLNADGTPESLIQEHKAQHDVEVRYLESVVVSAAVTKCRLAQPAPTPSILLPVAPATNPLAFTLSGADIIAQDGTYLGFIGGQFDSDSIFNEFGTYGSKFQTKSIWNEFGTYGSKFSDYSAFNQFANKPPVITKDGRDIAYLTVNEFKSPRVTPYELQAMFK